MFHFHLYLCLSLMDWASHSAIYVGFSGNILPHKGFDQSIQCPVARRVFYWPNYTTNLTLDGSTSSPRVLSIAFAKRSMLSIQHSVEDPQPATPRDLNCWADPTGSVSTLTLRKRQSMDSTVRKCAPVNSQCALANVWLLKSIWVRLVAVPDVTLGHGPPNRICPQLLVPRSAKSFAATLSNGTESAS